MSKKEKAADKSRQSSWRQRLIESASKILKIRIELSSAVSLSIPFISPLFPSAVLQRHKLNQMSDHAVETQFSFSVSPTEPNRSAPVTSLLTLSFSLMQTQED